jgi:hypothetical protein
MTRRPKYPPAMVARMHRYYETYSLEQTAARFGVAHKGTVRNLFVAAGLPLRPNGTRSPDQRRRERVARVARLKARIAQEGR